MEPCGAVRKRDGMKLTQRGDEPPPGAGSKPAEALNAALCLGRVLFIIFRLLFPGAGGAYTASTWSEFWVSTLTRYL
jgi:hypothetical protein